MKVVFIAEKPLMAQAIATALSPSYQMKDGYLEGSNHLIFTWALGHLVQLSDFEAYDEKYKKWNFDDLPFLPNAFKLSPIASKQSQLMKIKSITKDADLIINATDAAVEGQLIFHYIAVYLKLLDKPTKRLWTSSLTPEAIQKAFKNMKDNKVYSPLLSAGLCRSQADFLIGMNATRAFTLKAGAGGELLSVGRLQTCILSMVYDRCQEHFAFKKTNYYPILATFVQNGTTFIGKWDGDPHPTKEVAERMALKVKNQKGRITEFTKKRKEEAAPKLYSLSLLQKEANKKYSYTAKDILDTAQSLYEKHKCISYPRTSSSYVTKAEIPEMHKVFAVLQKSEYRNFAEKGNPALVHEQNKAVCDEKKVEDHHAILPTTSQPRDLSEKERNIYDLIVRRFLAHFLEPASYEKYRVYTNVCDEPFKTTASLLLNKGWKELYIEEKEESEETTLATTLSLQENGLVTCTGTSIQETETKPLPLYTEGSLIDGMKKAGSKVEDEEARELMKHSGIGRESTRAATIELLKARTYIQAKGKALIITDKGRFIIETIRQTKIQTLTSADYTGEWEKRFKMIEAQTYSAKEFMKIVRKFTESIVSEAGTIQTTFVNEHIDVGTCPKCQKGKVTEGKKGYGCSLWKEGCTFTIWKTQYGKSLSIPQVKALLEKKETTVLTFTNQKKKKYKAKLILTEEWKIDLAFAK